MISISHVYTFLMRKWKDASAIVSGPSSFSLRVLPAPYIGFLYLVGICCQRHSASQDVKLIMSISEGKPSCATLVSVFLEPDQTCPGFRMLRFILMSQEAAPKLGMR
jgi:hypothetical protein